MGHRINRLRTALAVALIAVAGPAAALGLGQIQVKSRVDQPLLAEIPIISSDPAELEMLQARLASPETFRRIGLEPPTGAAADLNFSVALDERGRPVIRVTSNAPVGQPLVTFLVEVDWGSGRLVREYSALLDTPRTVAAPAQPPIEAPTTAPSNVIERPLAAEPVAPAEPEPAPIAEESSAEAPAEAANDIAVAPPSPAPTAAPADIPAPMPTDRVSVQEGATLSAIAAQVGPRGYTLDQTMLALLRANPDAFIRGNINLLKAGTVLRVPPAEDAAQLDAREAAVVVRDHLDQWRALRAPAPQPASVAEDATATAAATPDTSTKQSARVAGARLEIVPPSGNERPGTQSGASAGGEGDMLRQELNQTKEDLAARTAEVDDLKARVAELEQLQKDQAALIQLKDSRLAAAEQRLAQANTNDAKSAATTTAAAQPEPAQPAVPAWLWGGAALVVFGLLAWLFTRRRAPAPRPAEPRRGYDTEALAAGMPKVSDVRAGSEPIASEPIAPAPDFVEVGRAAAPRSHAATDWTSSPAALGAAPTWHGGAPLRNSPEMGNVAASLAEPNTAAQQLELARAYLDMGDDDAARVVLREVLASRDPSARDEAARMLRDL